MTTNYSKKHTKESITKIIKDGSLEQFLKNELAAVRLQAGASLCDAPVSVHTKAVVDAAVIAMALHLSPNKANSIFSGIRPCELAWQIATGGNAREILRKAAHRARFNCLGQEAVYSYDFHRDTAGPTSMASTDDRPLMSASFLAFTILYEDVPNHVSLSADDILVLGREFDKAVLQGLDCKDPVIGDVNRDVLDHLSRFYTEESCKYACHSPQLRKARLKDALQRLPSGDVRDLVTQQQYDREALRILQDRISQFNTVSSQPAYTPSVVDAEEGHGVDGRLVLEQLGAPISSRTCTAAEIIANAYVSNLQMQGEDYMTQHVDSTLLTVLAVLGLVRGHSKKWYLTLDIQPVSACNVPNMVVAENMRGVDLQHPMYLAMPLDAIEDVESMLDLLKAAGSILNTVTTQDAPSEPAPVAETCQENDVEVLQQRVAELTEELRVTDELLKVSRREVDFKQQTITILKRALAVEEGKPAKADAEANASPVEYAAAATTTPNLYERVADIITALNELQRQVAGVSNQAARMLVRS